MANITQESEEHNHNRKVKNTYIKVKHPDSNTWVEFKGMSLRQLEVLTHYKQLINDNTK